MESSDSNTILSLTQQLTDVQINRVFENYKKIKHFDHHELIFEGKPKKKNIEKAIRLNTLAKKYEVYLLTRDNDDLQENDFNKENIEVYKECNKKIKLVNLQKRKELFIICYCDKFDVSFVNSVIYFEDYFNEYKPDQITIVTTNRLMKKLNIREIIEKTYRCKTLLFSLFDIYPLIGSPNCMYGLAYGYELIEHEESYNNKQYKLIDNNDPIVKLLGGSNGQLIIHMRTTYETSPYSEISVREIVGYNNN